MKKGGKTMEEKLFANSSDMEQEEVLTEGFQTETEPSQENVAEDGNLQEKDTERVAKAEEQTHIAPPSQEQFTQDLKALLRKRPELEKEGTLLPEPVLKAYLQGENLLAAYLEYEGEQNSRELTELRRQNKIYQQNQTAAEQAPIKKGVSGGGVQGEDPMLAGFDEPYW
jgi:hypothetical protein